MTIQMASARLPSTMVRGRSRLAGMGTIPSPRPRGYDADGNEYVVLRPGPGTTATVAFFSEQRGGPTDDIGIVEDVTLQPGEQVLVPVQTPSMPDTYVIVRTPSKLMGWGIPFALGWAGGFLVWYAIGKSRDKSY